MGTSGAAKRQGRPVLLGSSAQLCWWTAVQAVQRAHPSGCSLTACLAWPGSWRVVLASADCRLGSTRGKELIAKARADDSFKIDRELIDDLLETLEQTSLCALGGGVPLPIKNALQHFEEELSAYFAGTIEGRRKPNCAGAAPA